MEDDEQEAIVRDCGGKVAVWAKPVMEAFIDEQIQIVRDHRATLDLAAIDRDRAEAADRALFDTSREASLARRYEAAARRNVYRALKELPGVEAGLLPDDPDAHEEAQTPSSTSAEAIEVGDATPEGDPADELAQPQIVVNEDVRPPLASFGITAERASWELSNPVAGEPMLPLDEPLADVSVYGTNTAHRRRWT